MDGAYYAIKGYSYQFDKTLIAILSNDDEESEVGVEKIQDLDHNDYVFQIKYRETKDYTNTSLREPVMQLLQLFKTDPEKTYIIYCHFNNRKEEVWDVKVTDLDIILSKVNGTSNEAIRINKELESISQSDKESFASKFKIVFAPKFQKQFEEVLGLIKQVLPEIDDEQAVFHHSQLVGFLQTMIISDPEGCNRVCNKKQIVQLLRGARSAIFTTEFKEYRGAEAYFKFVEKEFERGSIHRNWNNFFIIGNIEIDEICSVDEVVVSLIESYFQNAKTDIKPPLVALTQRHLTSVKESLIEKGVMFNDGYETIKFSVEILAGEPIKNKVPKGRKGSDSLSKISFHVRLVSIENLPAVADALMPNKVYCFNSLIPEEFAGIPFVKVDGLSTKYLVKFLK